MTPSVGFFWSPRKTICCDSVRGLGSWALVSIDIPVKEDVGGHAVKAGSVLKHLIGV